MTAVMVQGCTSSAGKSLLTTALCRWYADRGLRVAPFKAQNMSTNSRVADGGEMGVAQWVQALAARVRPDVRMNPVLVKPERGGSQVIVAGQVDSQLTRLPWLDRAPRLWPAITQALDSLLGEFDLVVCEGAGSPAEVNLRTSDLANMPVARHARAPVLLVADIERGGALAHVVGTWDLLDPDDRSRLTGFVLNRFRGDPALLAGGPDAVTARTGVPYAGLLPVLDHDLPDEDGAVTRWAAGSPPDGAPVVALVRYPSASNLDEFTALDRAARVLRARRAPDLLGADLVVLPGSKDVAADLDWLHRVGLARGVVDAARAGRRVLGICGGLHMLGEEITDPEGLEGGRGPWRRAGLGLLPLLTVYRAPKAVGDWRGSVRADLRGPWGVLAGREVAGYEIRYGRSGPATTSADGTSRPASSPAGSPPAPGVTAALARGLGWARGPVLGLAGHGVLEDPDVLAAILGSPVRGAGELHEDTARLLAGAVDTHLDTALLAAAADRRSR